MTTNHDKPWTGKTQPDPPVRHNTRKALADLQEKRERLKGWTKTKDTVRRDRQLKRKIRKLSGP